jgi:hypothetical protein
MTAYRIVVARGQLRGTYLSNGNRAARPWSGDVSVYSKMAQRLPRAIQRDHY